MTESLSTNQQQDFLQTELDKIVEVVTDILPGIWRQVDYSDLIITKCLGGIANRVFSVQLNSKLADQITSEPDQVIVRLYGSTILKTIDEPRLMGDDVELLLFHLLSESGLGPKLLGAFGKGRIEEYIPNVRPTSKELESKSIDHAMTSLFARIHSLQFPITRKHVFMDFLFHGELTKRANTKEGEFIVNYTDSKANQMADMFDAFPFTQELDLLDSLSVKVSAKSVFCHHDLHLYNILFRENGKCQQQVDDDKDDYWIKHMVPIDFELGSYGWRGYDLAYYLNFRYYHPCEGGTDYEAIRFPNEDEVQSFLQSYLTHLSNVDPNFDPIVDNIEQLTKEVALGSLYTHLFLFGWEINSRRFESLLEWSKEYPLVRFKKYQIEKKKFLEEYGFSSEMNSTKSS